MTRSAILEDPENLNRGYKMGCLFNVGKTLAEHGLTRKGRDGVV